MNTTKKIRRYQTPELAFAARTEPIAGDPGCIAWLGSVTDDGYGRITVDGRNVKAHRYAWSRANGPVPEGLELDHICRVRSCVNVDHLRLATQSQNLAYRPLARRDLPGNVERTRTGFRAAIKKDGQRFRTRTFSSLAVAALAAHLGSRHFHGEFSPYPEIPADVRAWLLQTP